MQLEAPKSQDKHHQNLMHFSQSLEFPDLGFNFYNITTTLNSKHTILPLAYKHKGHIYT
jgi:hypothetical protein